MEHDRHPPTPPHMNKHALARELAVSERLTITTAYKAIDGLLRIITGELSRGGGLALPEFGLLYARRQRARTVVDPDTGKILSQPPRLTVSFHPYAELHAVMNPRASSSDAADEPPCISG